MSSGVGVELTEGLGVGVSAGLGVEVPVELGAGVGVGPARWLVVPTPKASAPALELAVGEKLEAALTASGALELVELKREKLDPTAESIASIGAARRTTAARKIIGKPAVRR
ncbi:MAG: hypothetical protein WBZ07_10235 [Candidatus Dormiibacterota bacterium]